MEAEIFVAVNMTNLAKRFLGRRMGSSQGLVDDKRRMNTLPTRRHDGDQVLISYCESIKESNETLETTSYCQLKPKM